MKKTLGIFLLAAVLMPAVSFATDKVTFSNQDKKNLDVACVQKAIGIREDSLIATFDTFSATAKTALTARKDALVTAWGKTDAKERRTARKAAYDAHKATMKTAHETLKTSKKAAWNTFNTSIQSCGSTVSGYSEMTPSDLPTSL